MRSENALLGDSEERLGRVPRKTRGTPLEKGMLANRGFPTEAATTALHSDLRIMARTGLFLLEIPCRGSVAHVALRSTSLGRSKDATMYFISVFTDTLVQRGYPKYSWTSKIGSVS